MPSSQLSPFLQLLKNKNFLKLWLAQLCGQTGMNALHFVLVIQVFERTGNNFVVGILIALLSLPSIIVSPIAGVVADSFDRKSLLLNINIVRLIATVLILLSFKLPAVLIGLAFITTMASQFFVPVEQASIPDIVSKEKLLTANSFFTFSLYGSFLIGFAGAGPLLEFTGEFTTLVVISVLFFLAAFLDSRLPVLEGHLNGNVKSIFERLQISTLTANLKEGLSYIAKQKSLLVMISLVAFIFSVERAVIALVPALAQNILGFTISEISFYMIIPLALGTVAGVIVVNRLKTKIPLMSLIAKGLMIDAIVLFLLPMYTIIANYIQHSTFIIGSDTPLKVYIALLAFASGLADVLIIVSTQTYIQRHVDTEVRGRVFASLTTSMNLVGVPLVLIISLMADLLNILITLVSFGIATVIVSIWAWWFFKNNHQVTPSVK